MLGHLARRGPDAEGRARFDAGAYAGFLGHRRLSIIDVAGGSQPMWSREQDVCIAFNGEIFNFKELREELSGRGVPLKTSSDTEVLLHWLREASGGSAELEDQALRRLNGMFALALWDARHESLLLARDRHGIKPLYYAELSDGGLAFSSALEALLELPDDLFDHSLDLQGVSDFFFHDYAAAPGTLVRGVKKLGLGESLVWKPGRSPRTRVYWSPDRISGPGRGAAGRLDEEVHADRLLSRLKSAVKRQLISDVPVGVFLSGGLDSSVVAALAAAETHGALRTFSIGFSEATFDESAYAREVAALLGAEHHEETLTEPEMLSQLDLALDCLDEPIADASILPTFCVSRLARSQVKVCLGGDGSDELWAGYPFYSAHRYGEFYGQVPEVLRERLINPLVRGLPVRDTYQSLEWKAKRFVNRWERDPASRHLRWLAGTDLPELAFLSGDGLPLPSLLEKNLGTIPADSIDGFLRLDLTSYLPGSVLAKLDRASMGNGLEARPPFLDNDVVELALGLPQELKLRDGVSKYLLKKAAAGLVPQRVLDRRKQGFSVPLARWMRSRLRERAADAIEGSEIARAGFLDKSRLKLVFQEHQAGVRDWGKTLWAVLVFEHWFKRNAKRLRVG